MKRTYAIEAVVEIDDNGFPRIEFVRVRQVVPGGASIKRPGGDVGDYDLHFATINEVRGAKQAGKAK